MLWLKPATYTRFFLKLGQSQTVQRKNVPRWNAFINIDLLVPNGRRRLPQKSAATGRTKIKTEIIQNVTWTAPPTARARQNCRSNRTGHGRVNRLRRTHGNDGRRKTTTLDDGRPTIARRTKTRNGRRRTRHACDAFGCAVGGGGGGERTVIGVAFSSARALCTRRPRAHETYCYQSLSSTIL